MKQITHQYAFNTEDVLHRNRTKYTIEYPNTYMLCKCLSLAMSFGKKPSKPWLSRPLHKKEYILVLVLCRSENCTKVVTRMLNSGVVA